MTKFTTLVVVGLDRHPRRVIINEREYEVACSSDGHIPAQIQELEQFLACASAGELRDMNDQDVTEWAQRLKAISTAMREKGFEG